ncbi:hypothetical protein [Quadrisphaera sp. DSM 44207]|uniref:hypothetical protein n=1 Tax=Quadrisphaera sp. DSM 44207 TaxID=1881057 RepID=UPI00088D8743|nr:hypothetical protein [Quadrisphaera sp. DSM 44207]SDQ35618.1 hypothetical protein SAMN05428996_1380 [Quadrisphaera sp. DSM 44207]
MSAQDAAPGYEEGTTTDLTRSTTPPDGCAELSRTEHVEGSFVSVRTDEVRTGPDSTTTYDVVAHPGGAAVAAVAAVRSGDITSAMTVAGLLAVAGPL